MTTVETTTERDRWFAGTLVRILAEAGDTGGRLGLMEQVARRGFSPPRHVHHREDTALLVLDGTITAEVGEERVAAGPGAVVWMPRDVPHTFRVESATARLLEVLTPGGFERFHVDASDAAPALELPPEGEPDVARLVVAVGGYGAEIVGPPMGAEG